MPSTVRGGRPHGVLVERRRLDRPPDVLLRLAHLLLVGLRRGARRIAQRLHLLDLRLCEIEGENGPVETRPRPGGGGGGGGGGQRRLRIGA